MRQTSKTSRLASEGYARGRTLYGQGRYEEAIEALTAPACAPTPVGQMARYYLGMAHREMGIECMQASRHEPAEKHLREAMRVLGRQSDLAGYLASLYARDGQMERSMGELEKSLDADVPSPRQYAMLALAQWRSGRRAPAYMTLTAGLRQFGSEARLETLLGRFYASEQRYDEARAAFRRAAEADCTSAEPHYHLGLIAAAEGRPVAAARRLQRAWALRGEDLLLAHQLSLAVRAAAEQGRTMVVEIPEPGEPDGGDLQRLAQYVAREPEFVGALLDMEAPEGSSEELLELLAGVLSTALARRPEYADLRVQFSRVLQRLGRAEEAAEQVAAALERNPRYTQALVQFADLREQAGRTDEAIELWERAIASGGDWADVHCHLGELLLRSGRADEARTHLRRALELNANYDKARRLAEAA